MHSQVAEPSEMQLQIQRIGESPCFLSAGRRRHTTGGSETKGCNAEDGMIDISDAIFWVGRSDIIRNSVKLLAGASFPVSIGKSLKGRNGISAILSS